MKIKIGDHVRFLNDVGEGIVKKLADRNMVEVETSDGWTIPYLISELIVIPDKPDEEPFRPETPPVVFHETTTVPNSELSVEPAVFLLAVKDADGEESLKGLRWYLVNDSAYVLDFAFYVQEEDAVTSVERDQLEPGTKIFLQEINSQELGSIKGFHIQGVLTQEDIRRLPPLVSAFIPFTVKKFNADGAYQENDYLHEAAIVYDVIHQPQLQTVQVDEQDVQLAQESRKESGSNRSVKKNRPLREVDLHINELVESVVGMSNREILKVQLAVFERELNQAIQDREKEIVFIHGIGNGTLKESLRKTIESDYPVCSIEDASYKKYGFGATLVFIRQNR